MGEYPIGYLKDSIDELEQTIRQIVDGNLKNDFDKELDLLSQKVSIPHNTKLFKEQLKRVHLYD